jgi:hypothetical protein
MSKMVKEVQTSKKFYPNYLLMRIAIKDDPISSNAFASCAALSALNALPASVAHADNIFFAVVSVTMNATVKTTISSSLIFWQRLAVVVLAKTLSDPQ